MRAAIALGSVAVMVIGTNFAGSQGRSLYRQIESVGVGQESNRK